MAGADRVIRKNPGKIPMSDPLDTPVMRQYLELKKMNPDAVLFFRMGDFYEMFLEDAKEAAPIMDIALTKRQNSVPMAGVPYHSVDTYIARLISAGKKVAIAEQSVDPKNPKLMRRIVKRVVSPGTLVEESLLKNPLHNYLMSLTKDESDIGIALADVSTGDFFTIEIEAEENIERTLSSNIRDIFFKYGPCEILIPTFLIKEFNTLIPEVSDIITGIEDWKAFPTEGIRQIDAHYNMNINGLGYDNNKMISLGAASMVLHYMSQAFPGQNHALNPPVFHRTSGEYMLLDEQTIRNMDLIYNAQEGSQNRSLYGVLNYCKTSVGKRRLKEALLMPLLGKEAIEFRQNITYFLAENDGESSRIITALNNISDLERIISRMTSGRGAPRDFISLRDTIQSANQLVDIINALSSRQDEFKNLIVLSDRLQGLAEYINKKIIDDPPAILGNGPLLKSGVNTELDEAREASKDGSRWIVEFEKKEKERTGISSLRIRYNKIVGYYIEISKGQTKNAPDNYQQKQTLVSGTRYSCETLNELERSIKKADEIIGRIENDFFDDICEKILNHHNDIKEMMKGIAELDFLNSLASAGARYGWVKPVAVSTGELIIEDGRHPVVETFLPPGEDFIPNSITMDSTNRSFTILTGPNMAGKSTFIRQVALIQLLMQIGSLVPARHATISIADRIFTRIGASDNLTRGESTFFVEMLEAARILNQATERSLVIMDEVGRGTSTYDGLAIAWSVVEYFTGDNDSKPRVLFATHYHELTVLESRAGVFNLTMDVQETAGKIIFMHRVRDGHADRSYGIHVARLAGLPPEVTDRAEEKLAELEKDYLKKKQEPPQPAIRRKRSQMNVKKEIKDDQGYLF